MRLIHSDYVVNATVMAANFGAGGQTGTMPDLAGNVAPVLTVEGERMRRVKAGEPVPLIAVAIDDGKPRARPMQQFGSRTVPNSATGLRLVWLVYRGAGEVTFAPTAVQRMGRYALRRKFAVGSGLEDAPGPCRQQMGDARHL